MPTTSGLPVTRLVQVSVVLTTPAVTAPAIDTCLLLGTSNVIDTVERMRNYPNAAAVAADFGTACEEYWGATVWFSQTPAPANLFIGRWAKTATAATLVGGVLSTQQQLLSNWTAVTTGGLTVTIDGGTPAVIANLNFSAAVGLGGLNSVASILQTAIRAGGSTTGYTQAVVTWDANNSVFRLTSGTTGSASAVTFMTPPVPGPVTDVASMLNMTAALAQHPGQGVAPETALAAVTLLDQMFSSQWYGLVVPSGTEVAAGDHMQIAAYCEAAQPPHYYGVTTSNPNSLVAANTTDIGAMLKGYGYNKSTCQYSTSLQPGATQSYAVLSYLARILTTAWRGLNTTITLMYKQEPGVNPENITSANADALMNKYINVYVTYANGAKLIQYGTSASGQFTDTIIGADALALDLQASLFNVLYTSVTKIQQTDPGMQLLVNAATATCAQYAGNGWLGAGTWSAQGFGTLKTGDLLQMGYYVYAPSMLTQSPADRAARRSPLIQVAAKCAGAIHTAQVVVFVNQ